MSQFYKIVKNLATRYLNELLTKLSTSERTHFRLRSRGHFTQLLCRTSTFQVFFPISSQWLEFSGPKCPKHCISSRFKAITRSILFPHTYNRLYDRSLSRRAPVDHTRLRLGFSCQSEYLFKINSCVSPICECSFDSESVKHFFLHCPRYAAQRHVLLTSAANILGETWSSSSDARKLNFLLYGV